MLFRPGAGLIVALVSPSNEPYATRAWAAAPVAGDATTVRILLPADDAPAAEHAVAGTAIAITASDVRTLRSAQAKGRIVAVDEVSEDDVVAHDAYVDAFFAAIEEVDRVPRSMLDRIVPASFVVCLVEVDEFFDQTPGPGAGARLAGGAP